ncbi:C40 family peptidase [Enterovirga aerilata]|uniref:C40 family peptidase n=1 Tax=Enterovirga aerilata TaxID=2730920 RepID=A0A849I2P9_9HYPH|nr:C40 family peptidase [Enterovirga sp. DB1703]NNM73662.1 C40 family peptidase [Enterovirga sp. DB1703]
MATFDKRLTPARSDLADERLRGLVDAPRYVAGAARRVTAPSAPLRREPYPDAPLDTEVLMGDPVTVYDEHEGYAWVQLGSDGYVGYMPSEALGPAAPAPTHRVTALRSFVYPGPNLKLPHSAFLSLGAVVTPVEVRNEYVRLSTGGWVFGGHLSQMHEHAADFVAVAERLVGTPYLWGGKTSLGLDCSGLVQLSLAMAGMAAPRDTDMQQSALGTEVGPDPGLRRGDLVFWHGHVGIMLDEARLLHANGHHMAVAIEELAEAEHRIREKSFGPITAVKRLERPGRTDGTVDRPGH